MRRRRRKVLSWYYSWKRTCSRALWQRTLKAESIMRANNLVKFATKDGC